MKTTKRFLALILALILAASGILSGIPGGGVVRAEESTGKKKTASLSQDMSWDVGTEIVGDVTVDDLAGEPWAEDSSSSAVVEEEGEAENPSIVIEEEAEEGVNESLTNETPEENCNQDDLTGLCESEWNEPTENNDNVVMEDENINSTNNTEFNDSDWLSTIVPVSLYEEEAEESQETVVAGAGLGGNIYFTTDGINSNQYNWSMDMTTIYVYRWGGSGTPGWTQINNPANDVEKTGAKIFTIDMTDYAYVVIASRANGGGCYQADDLPGGGSNGQSSPRSIKVGYAYQLYNFSENPNSQNPNARHQHIRERGEYDGTGGGDVSNRIKTIYFDSTLSVYSYAGDKDVVDNHHKSMPNSTDGNTIYALGSNDGSTWINLGAMTESASGSNLWSKTFETTYQYIRFTAYNNTGTSDNGDSTDTLTWPTNVAESCFFADTGDTVMYKNGKRGGFWGRKGAIRDPEAERTAKGKSGNIVDVGSEAISTTNVVSDPQLADQSGQVYYITNTTFYDYYSDYELNGENRKDYPNDLSNGYSERNYLPFRQLDLALSKYYSNKTNNNVGTNAYLYTGHFQPKTFWSTNNNDSDAEKNRWKYTLNGLNLFGWDTSNPDSDLARRFFAVNNSTTNVDGVGNDDIRKYNMALQGLMASTQGGTAANRILNGNYGAASPYFDEDFLSGNNSKNTVLAKVYKNVAFPMTYLNRDGNGVYYWSFDSAYKTEPQLIQKGDDHFNSSHTALENYSEEAIIDGTNATQVLRMKKTSDGNYWLKNDPSGAGNSSLNVHAGGNVSDGRAVGFADDVYIKSASGSSNWSGGNAQVKPGREVPEGEIYYGVDGSAVSNKYGFFPLNDGSVSNDARKYNYGLGMKMQVTFNMSKMFKSDGTNKKYGYVEGDNSTYYPIVFTFSGDDDLWVYIDDQLVLDVGGDHGRASGCINFAQSDASSDDYEFNYYDVDRDLTTYSGWATGYANDGTLGQLFKWFLHGHTSTVQGQTSVVSSAKKGFTNSSGDETPATQSLSSIMTADWYTKDHTMTIYYMERGLWESNLKMQFNIPIVPDVNVEIDKEFQDPEGNAITPMNASAWNSLPDALQFRLYRYVDSQSYTIGDTTYNSSNPEPVAINGNYVISIPKSNTATNGKYYYQKLEGLPKAIEINNTSYDYTYIAKEYDGSNVHNPGDNVTLQNVEYTYDFTSEDPVTSGHTTTYKFHLWNRQKTAKTNLTIQKEWKQNASTSLTGDFLQEVKVYLRRTANSTNEWYAYDDEMLTTSWVNSSADATPILLNSGNSWTKTLNDLTAVVDPTAGSLTYYTYSVFEAYGNGTMTASPLSSSGQSILINGIPFQVTGSISGTNPALGSTENWTATVTNTLSPVSAKLTKTWIGNDIADSLKVQLQRKLSTTAEWPATIPSGDKTDFTITYAAGVLNVSPNTNATITRDGTNTNIWYLTVSNLDKYNSASVQYDYRFVEIDGANTVIADNGMLGDYRVDYEGVSSGLDSLVWNSSSSMYEQAVSNLKTVDLSVKKTWNIHDGTNATSTVPLNMSTTGVSSNIPSSVFVSIYRTTNASLAILDNGEVTVSDWELVAYTPSGGSAATKFELPFANYDSGLAFADLPKYDTSGNAYRYRFVEVDSSGSVLTKSTLVNSSFGFYPNPKNEVAAGSNDSLSQTLENVDTLVDIQVEKTWQNMDGTGVSARPSIKVRLMNGANQVETGVLDGTIDSGGSAFEFEAWKGKWQGLPRHSTTDGSLIIYVVKEYNEDNNVITDIEGDVKVNIGSDGRTFDVTYSNPTSSNTANTISASVTNSWDRIQLNFHKEFLGLDDTVFMHTGTPPTTYFKLQYKDSTSNVATWTDAATFTFDDATDYSSGYTQYVNKRLTNGNLITWRVLELRGSTSGDPIDDNSYVLLDSKLYQVKETYTVSSETRTNSGTPAANDTSLSLYLANQVQPPSLKVNKKDEAGNLITTANAVFTLTQTSPSPGNNYTAPTATTSSGVATFSSLGQGNNSTTYTLTETSAPTGYTQVSGNLATITVDNLGTLTVSNLVSGVSAQGSSVNATVTVNGSVTKTNAYVEVNVTNPHVMTVNATKVFYADGGTVTVTPPANSTVFLQLFRQYGSTPTEDNDFAAEKYIVQLDGTQDQTGSSYESSGWTATWTGLPKYQSVGVPYTYYVKEVADNQGAALTNDTITLGSGTSAVTYAVTYNSSNSSTGAVGSSGASTKGVSGNASTHSGTTYVINTEKPTKVSVTIEKQYKYSDGTTALTGTLVQPVNVLLYRRPESGTFSGTGYYTDTNGTVTWESNPTVNSKIALNASNSPTAWTATIENLDAYAQIHETRIKWVYELYEYPSTAGSTAPADGSTATGPLTNTPATITINGVAFKVTGGIVQTAEPAVGTTDTVYNGTVTNTLDAKVNAQLTKVWSPITAQANSIVVQLEQSPGSWTNDAGTVIGTYTITKPADASSNPTVSSSGTNPPTATPSKDASGNWVITIANLEKYNTSSVPYIYRFVEMNSSARAANGSVIDGYKVTYTGKNASLSYGEAVDSNNDGTMTQTITNEPANVKIDIFKVVEGSYVYNDGTKPGTPLKDAEFKLQKIDKANGNSVIGEWTLKTGNDGKDSSDNATPSSGYAALAEGLGEGDYKLFETVAPAGYAMHSGVVEFSVTVGEVRVTSSTASGLYSGNLTAYTGYSVPNYTDGAIKTYHFVFENTAGTELPGTGTVFGLSRMGFAGLGTVLLTAFIVLYQYKKRRQYYGDWKE